MKSWRTLIALTGALLALALFLGLIAAAPGALEPGGVVVPLGTDQADLRAAYAQPLRHLYGGGRLHRLASAAPGDLYLPPGEVDPAAFCPTCTRQALSGTLPLSRAYALRPARVALFRSSVTYSIGEEEGEGVAMWEYAHVRELFDGYLRGAVPYATLDESALLTDLEGYDLLILPAFNREAQSDLLNLLDEGGGLTAIHDFVAEGGMLYAQGTGLLIAQAAGVLPEGMVAPDETLELEPPDDFANRGRLHVLLPDSPLALSWLTDTLYILDDPVLRPGEGEEVTVVAELTNVEDYGSAPALFHASYGTGAVVGVVGHPTDPIRRNQVPLFMDVLLLALSGYADFYGDAVQTFNPLYPPHEFPAYEEVPVSATLHVENLWDAPLGDAVVTETIAPGYVLTGSVTPPYTHLSTTPEGETLIVWALGDLDPHAAVTLSYRAVTSPTVLAAGISTFSTGELAYTDLAGDRVKVQHRPFVLYAQMAARLVGDRDLEPDRHYRIPAEGLYLDLTLPLENKEETPAHNVVVTDWVYLIAPIVDYRNQHVILSANDGETIWMRNEPYLWGERYPLWEGATAPTQTLTLDDWRGDRCVFTSTYGIHIDPPPLLHSDVVTDYGSFITIPPTYTDYITVTAGNELLLPCQPITWNLGAFNGYEYAEPALRHGVHSSELLGREVRFHGTPREGTVVIPNDAGSVYVAAGTHPVPFRQYLETATPYAAQAPAPSLVTWQDVWSRTHTLPLRATFYDVWNWDSCATCGGEDEQHAGVAVTFGIWMDADGDGEHETLVKEIPTRLDEARLRLLGKTYSVNAGDYDFPIPEGENVIELPIFKGLGIKIGPEGATWWDSWRSVGPGASTLISVSEQIAYDHLFFQQEIPPGSWASFLISATVENYPFNREGLYKLHDGARLVYRQQIAGPNRYEVYDSHVHAAEGWRSDAEIDKRGGPTLVSVYSDTLIFDYLVTDPYEPRQGWDYVREYDPYLKCWGYGDLVWCSYVGGSEGKTLFRSVLGEGGRTRVRISLDNNTGITLTNLSVALDLPAGIDATLLYTDPTTAPEPIWPEMSFLNRPEVPDAWRSVWYFDLEVGEVDESLWGQVLEIPVLVSADGLPADYTAPPVRVALEREGERASFVSAPAHSLVLTDTLPPEVRLDAALLITDPVALDELWLALDADAGDLSADTAAALFDSLAPTRALTLPFSVTGNVVTFELPEALRSVPAGEEWHLVTRASLLRAHHGTNVVNEGPVIHYTDPFSVTWEDQGPQVTVEAHGAAVWVEYECEGGYTPSSLPGSARVTAYDGDCTLPNEPAEVEVDVTAYNAGDAIARGVTLTLFLPGGVTITYATPSWSFIDREKVGWNMGDLAPGGWKEFEIVLYVEPDESEWKTEAEARSLEGPYVMGQILGIDHSDGAFIDAYSDRFVEGRVADGFWFNVRFVPHVAYLPVVLRDYVTGPDLVIVALDVDPQDPSQVELRIANRGTTAARAFWIDLYLDPPSPPQVNQPWSELGCLYGAAWYVDALEPGGELLLRIGDDYYQAVHSRWPGFSSGEHALWAYVDSWGHPNPWGGVRELDEGNNRYGPVTFTAASSVGENLVGEGATPVPPRPRHPQE
ncbi:MAG: hypothetical protein ACLFU8_13700 [Anaerolineales bacterium]